LEGSLGEIAAFDWKSYFPLLSPIVVILLFGIERFLSYKIRKREIERAWYYKVLIDPILPKIDGFFAKVPELYNNTCDELNKSKDLSHQEFRTIKSRGTGIFQDEKRRFHMDIVTPILHRYPNTGNGLQEMLINLEDKFTNNIDKELFSDDDKDEFSLWVSNVKASWINVLYNPIAGKDKKW